MKTEGNTTSFNRLLRVLLCALLLAGGDWAAARDSVKIGLQL